jgi:hypothetical protein
MLSILKKCVVSRNRVNLWEGDFKISRIYKSTVKDFVKMNGYFSKHSWVVHHGILELVQSHMESLAWSAECKTGEKNCHWLSSGLLGKTMHFVLIT